MRCDLKRKWAHAVAVAALVSAPQAVLAQPGGDKPGGDKPKAGAGKDSHAGHDHGPGEHHGHAHGKAGAKPGDEAPPGKPVAAPVLGPQAAQAVDATTTTCVKATELRANIESIAAKRAAAILAIAAAQRESRKQVAAVTAAQKKLERTAGKAGSDSAGQLESARVAYEAAVAQAYTVETETRSLQASEDELTKLVTTAEEAATACAAAEATLRSAADAAKKAAGNARREAGKARLLARLLPAKAIEAARAKQTRDLEALKAGNDKAKAALEAMKLGPPAAKGPDKPAKTPTAKAP